MGKVFDEEIVTLKADFMKLGALVSEAERSNCQRWSSLY